MRPKSLAEVARLVAAGNSFDLSLAEFLDEFYYQPGGAAIQEEPMFLHDLLSNGAMLDAYLAATAESLACKYHFESPAWPYRPERQLHHPWFALPYASMRAILLWESPAAFRSRNLFVSENALSRA